ncbi:MAG: hypothetical protein DWI58_08670 [Chloroflexi bacterium]|nr:MAG: hypothetical protein DWI58_08670 [Chloroflexota bacterium]
MRIERNSLWSRSTQPGSQLIASSSTWGTPITSARRAPMVLFPLPEGPMTWIRRCTAILVELRWQGTAAGGAGGRRGAVARPSVTE